MRDKILKLSVYLCIVGLLVFSFKYYANAQKAVNFIVFERSFNTLGALNSHLDVNFNSKAGTINYDEISLQIEKIEKVLEGIWGSKLIVEKKFGDSLALLQASFKEKFEAIDDIGNLNRRNALLLNALANEFKKLENKEKLASLFAKISTINYQNPYEISKLNYELSSLKPEDETQREFLHLSHMISKNLNTISHKIFDINFQINDKIMLVFGDFMAYANAHYKYLDRLSLAFLAICIFVLFVFSIMFAKFLLHKDRLEILKSALNNDFSAVLITDKNFIIRYVNEIFVKNFGYEGRYEDKILSASLFDLVSQNFSTEIIQANLQSQDVFEIDNFDIVSNDGVKIPQRLKAFRIAKHQLYGFILLDDSKTQKIHQDLLGTQKMLDNQFFTDPLTVCQNEIALNSLIKNGVAGRIIYININNFTDLRFFYKTDATNEIIKKVANTLKNCINTYRINASIYRLQLDEFCIWYRGEGIETDIINIKKYFKNESFSLELDGSFIDARIDVTMGISDDKDYFGTDRVYQATLAHHEARAKNEKIGYYRADNIIEKEYMQNQKIIDILQYAISQKMVFVHVQPIFDITYKNIKNEFEPLYYEILIRISDKNGITHYPGEFLNIAKKTSLYAMLTKSVLNETFRLLAGFPKLKFGINISSLDVSNETFRDEFFEALRRCTNPENLFVEILESEEFERYEILQSFVAQVKTFGCKVGIDDFGSGYSNFYRVLVLDADFIKIDGSIVQQIAYDPHSKAIVETVVNFAKKQNYKIIAEYVENIEIMEILKNMGVTYVQGYLLSKPHEISKLIV